MTEVKSYASARTGNDFAAIVARFSERRSFPENSASVLERQIVREKISSRLQFHIERSISSSKDNQNVVILVRFPSTVQQVVLELLFFERGREGSSFTAHVTETRVNDIE